MKEIPILSANLIKQLDTDEPELDIKPDLSKDVIMYRAGRRSIIDELVIRQGWYEKYPNSDNKIKVEM